MAAVGNLFLTLVWWQYHWSQVCEIW